MRRFMVLTLATFVCVSAWSQTLTVTYSPYNNPSLKEYSTGKARVAEILDRVLKAGFHCSRDTLQVDISSKVLRDGRQFDWEDEGERFIVWHGTDSKRIERALLSLFEVEEKHGEITFDVGFNTTLEEFDTGVDSVLRVVQAFDEAGLKLEFPKFFNVTIWNSTWEDKNLRAFNSNTLYMHHSAGDEELERYLMQFVKPPQQEETGRGGGN